MLSSATLLTALAASLPLVQGAQAENGTRDLAQKTRRVIPAKDVGGSDTIALTKKTSGFRLEDVELRASPRTALIFFDHTGPHTNAVLRNSLIHVAPGTIALDRAYWGVRGYDMVDLLIDNVEVTGFGKVTPKHDEGHALYLNLAGDLDVDGCYIHHNGGQGLQLVNRPDESVFPQGPARGTITIRNTRLHENGFNPDRGGFQLSIFGTGQAIRIENVELVAGYDDTIWPKNRTGGGLLIEPEPFVPNRKHPWWRPDPYDAPRDLPEGFVPPFTQGRTELTRVTIRHRDPNRAIAQIKGCEELIVTDCTFASGQVQLDDPDKPGRDSGHIVWKGNHGDAQVVLRGEPIGVASDDFEIEDQDPDER